MATSFETVIARSRLPSADVMQVERLQKLGDGRWLVHGLQRHPGDEADDEQVKGPFDAVLLADILTCQPGQLHLSASSPSPCKTFHEALQADHFRESCFAIPIAMQRHAYPSTLL